MDRKPCAATRAMSSTVCRLLQERPHRRRVMLRDMIPEDTPLTNEGVGGQALRNRSQKRERNRVGGQVRGFCLTGPASPLAHPSPDIWLALLMMALPMLHAISDVVCVETITAHPGACGGWGGERRRHAWTLSPMVDHGRIQGGAMSGLRPLPVTTARAGLTARPRACSGSPPA
jgi:hypothetical protein